MGNLLGSRIFFVRHGESEANVLHEFSNRGWKHGLTDRGIAQVEELSQQLSDQKIRKIYTSPLKRAVETAQILASRLGVEYETTDSLREFVTGVTEGKRDDESWQLWKILMDNWNRLKLYESRIPGGESFNDLRSRFIPFIEKIHQEQSDSGSGLVLIGHGGLYYCMLPLVLNLSFDLIGSLPFPNTGYVLAESSPSGYVCREWCGVKM